MLWSYMQLIGQIQFARDVSGMDFVEYWNQSDNVRMPNSNKQHLILTKFYTNNALCIANALVEFWLNLSKETIVTVSFVRST